MTSPRDRVDAVIKTHPDWDHHQVARHLIRQSFALGVSDVLELVEPSLSDAVWQRLRIRRRAAEVGVFDDIGKGKQAAEIFDDYEYDPLEDFGRLLNHHFKLRGKAILYRDATLSDWTDRKNTLEQRQLKLHSQVVACDAAISVLQREGVATLGEAWEKSPLKEASRTRS